MVFENLLNPILNPLLELNSLLAIFIVSFLITLLITLVYKYTTNQSKLKQLKLEMKEKQKKIRELTKTQPEKAMKIQKDMMSSNMEMMKQSFKSTLYTFIPIIIIFGWLNAHMAFHEISPNQTFEITGYFAEGHSQFVSLSSLPELEIENNTRNILDGKAIWRAKGEAGEYKLIIDYNDEKYDKDLIISEKREYAPPKKKISDSKLKLISINNKQIKPLGEISLLGWKPGWLGTYILLSIIFSIGIRKLLKVY